MKILALLLVTSCLALSSGAFDSAQTLYNQGNFAAAAKLAASLGSSQGYALAARAISIEALTLPAAQQEPQYLSAERYARQAIGLNDKNPEAHFELARAVGRLGELRGIVSALLQGVGIEVKQQLERTLQLQPDHAEANAALGVWNAEVASRGGLAALTLGASFERVEPLLQKALQLEPTRIGHRIGYAQALLLMDAKANRARAIEQLQFALKQKPRNAEDRIQLELARAELERLQ